MTLLKSWTLPIEVYNEAAKANDHWRIKRLRHKAQAAAVRYHLKELSSYFNIPIKIKLIRISPRLMDTGDNLPYSFKWIRDSIADLIYAGLQPGMADNTNFIEWDYGQEKGEPKEKAMRVEVYENNT